MGMLGKGVTIVDTRVEVSLSISDFSRTSWWLTVDTSEQISAKSLAGTRAHR